MRKKILTIVLTGCMLMSMTGCGQTESTEKDNDTKQKMVIHLNGIDEDYKMQKAMDEIQKMDKYSNVDFEFHGREADFDTTVPVMIAGGEQVDIVIVANPMIQQQWADAGTIVPLNDLIEATGTNFEEEFGPYVENATNNGEIYTVPHNITRWVLYYNKDIFDAAGIPYPDSKVPMTWDEYQEVARQITAGEGADKKYGAFYLPWGTFTYGDAIMTLGGGEKFYNEEGLSNIENPAFAESMKRTHDMMHIDKSMPTHADVVTTKIEATGFMNGQYGMCVQGGWVLPWAADKENFPRDWKLGVAPMPVDEGETMKTWGVVNGFGISPTSADPELAFEIAMDLSRLSAENAMSSESANRSVSQDILFTGFEESLKEDGITVDQLLYVFTDPSIKFVGEKIMGPNNVAYEKVYMEEVEKYLVDEQDLDTTIANIKERGDKAIKDN